MKVFIARRTAKYSSGTFTMHNEIVGNSLRLTWTVMLDVETKPSYTAASHEAGGWPGLVYLRLHGSPRMYYSAYTERQLAEVAAVLESRLAAGVPCWCMFDNTTLGAATADALALQGNIRGNS